MTSQDRRNRVVATTVALVAAAIVFLIPTLRDDDAAAPIASTTTTAADTTAATGGALTFDVTASADGTTSFNPTKLGIDTAGPIAIAFANPSQTERRIIILGNGIAPILGPVTAAGESSRVDVPSLAAGTYMFGFANAAGDGIDGAIGTLTIGNASATVTPPPVDGTQTSALPENPPTGTAGPRIVGPWLTLTIRDRRFGRLKPAVKQRSYKINRYVKPGFWIRIDP